MIDASDTTLEIKIAHDRRTGYAVWIHVGGALAVRVQRAMLVLDVAPDARPGILDKIGPAEEETC